MTETQLQPLVQIKGIKEGLLVILGEGDWQELNLSLFELIDQQRDFLRGGKLYVDVGSQVLHAVRVPDCKGGEGASQGGRNTLIADAEISDVQLVDHAVFRSSKDGLLKSIPALGFDRRVI